MVGTRTLAHVSAAELKSSSERLTVTSTSSVSTSPSSDLRRRPATPMHLVAASGRPSFGKTLTVHVKVRVVLLPVRKRFNLNSLESILFRLTMIESALGQ